MGSHRDSGESPACHYLSQIPHEAQAKILTHLRTRDIAALDSACTAVRNWVGLATKLDFCHDPYDSLDLKKKLQGFAKFAQAKIHRGLHARTLSIVSQDPDDAVGKATKNIDKLLSNIIAACAEHLMDLELKNLPLCSESLQRVLSMAHKLRRFSVVSHKNVHVPTPFAVLAACKADRLEYVSWVSRKAASSEGAADLWAASPRLASLTLQGFELDANFHLPQDITCIEFRCCALRHANLFSEHSKLKTVKFTGTASSAEWLYPWRDRQAEKLVGPLMNALAALRELELLSIDFGFKSLFALVHNLKSLRSFTLDCTIPREGAAQDMYIPEKLEGVLRSDSLRELVVTGKYAYQGCLAACCPDLRVLSVENDLKKMEQVKALVAELLSGEHDKVSSCKLEGIFITRNIIASDSSDWQVLDLGAKWFEMISGLRHLYRLGFNTSFDDLDYFSRCTFPELQELRLTVDNLAPTPAYQHTVYDSITQVISRIGANCPKLRNVFIHMPSGIKVGAAEIACTMIASRLVPQINFKIITGDFKYALFDAARPEEEGMWVPMKSTLPHDQHSNRQTERKESHGDPPGPARYRGSQEGTKGNGTAHGKHGDRSRARKNSGGTSGGPGRQSSAPQQSKHNCDDNEVSSEQEGHARQEDSQQQHGSSEPRAAKRQDEQPDHSGSKKRKH